MIQMDQIPEKDPLLLAYLLRSLVHDVLQPTAAALLQLGVTRQRLAWIERAVRCQARNAEALLWLSQVLGGHVPAHRKMTARTIRSAVAAVLPVMERGTLLIDADVSVLSPPSVLEVVLANLITNARLYAPDSQISLRARLAESPVQGLPNGHQVKHPGPLVLLTVADDGKSSPSPQSNPGGLNLGREL